MQNTRRQRGSVRGEAKGSMENDEIPGGQIQNDHIKQLCVTSSSAHRAEAGSLPLAFGSTEPRSAYVTLLHAAHALSKAHPLIGRSDSRAVHSENPQTSYRSATSNTGIPNGGGGTRVPRPMQHMTSLPPLPLPPLPPVLYQRTVRRSPGRIGNECCSAAIRVYDPS